MLLLLALLITAGGMYLYYVKTHYASVTLSAREQTETRDLLNTSQGGWYQLYAYRLKPDTPIDDWHLYVHERDNEGSPCRLALLEFNLSSYRDRGLDTAAEENIKRVLQNFKKAKMKVILRFLYDWDGRGLESEPNSLSLIKKHMKQVSQSINPFHSMIYTTQGIFVGSWGEMHTSKYLTTKAMTDLLLYYASVTEDSIYLAVRTPEQYRNIMEELENNSSRYKKYTISKEELTKRLGLFNDGMLGSLSDVGTYHEADIAPGKKEGKEIRKKEIDFQYNLCLQVPNGGEVVKDNPYNDGERAIADLRAMRVSYLNQIYDEEVIKKWKKDTYNGEDTLYRDMSVYDYIARHLGPRFVLQKSSLHYEPYQTGSARGTVTVKNMGFSNLYHDMKLSIDIINKETGKRTTLLSVREKSEEYHPCRWSPKETITLPFEIAPFEFDAGEYTLVFSLSDSDTDEPFPLANDSYDESLKGYVLGSIQIKHD